MQGSQFRLRDGWLNDPLQGITNPTMPSLIPANFMPQTVPFVATVSQLTGSGTNSLAAIPTTVLPTPYVIEVTIGYDQRWELQAGTFATAVGVQRPNDYNAVTNAKVWVQIS